MQIQCLNTPAGCNARQILLILTSIALVFGIYPLGGLFLQQNGHGFQLNRMAPEFRLSTATGEIRRLSDYRGRYLYLMFGYMRCNDICHVQVNHLVALSDLLANRDIEFLYLAMDSRHDQPSMLRAYFDRRGDNFTSLHADSIAQMQSIAAAFKAGYRISGNPGSADYEIEHPAKIFLIDPSGQLRYVYNARAATAEQIAEDFHQLRQ